MAVRRRGGEDFCLAPSFPISSVLGVVMGVKPCLVRWGKVSGVFVGNGK